MYRYKLMLKNIIAPLVIVVLAIALGVLAVGLAYERGHNNGYNEGWNDGREFHRDYFKSIPSKQMLDMSLSRKINLINKINFGGLENE